MATYASVDAGYVVGMFEVADAVIDVDGVPVEALGQEFLTELYGPAQYLLTGTDGYRGCYPGIGYTWDGTIFAPPVEPAPEPTPEGRGALDVPKNVDNTVTLDTVES